MSLPPDYTDILQRDLLAGIAMWEERIKALFYDRTREKIIAKQITPRQKMLELLREGKL